MDRHLHTPLSLQRATATREILTPPSPRTASQTRLVAPIVAQIAARAIRLFGAAMEMARLCAMLAVSPAFLALLHPVRSVRYRQTATLYRDPPMGTCERHSKIRRFFGGNHIETSPLTHAY